MQLDSSKFGLTQDIEVKFFTPEEASKIPGASSGYNAVYKIGDGRVRYELLKAGKASGEVVAPAVVAAKEEVKVVEEQPVVNKQKAPKQKPVQRSEVSEEQSKEIVADEKTESAAE